jgi:DnaK suppressor protein
MDSAASQPDDLSLASVRSVLEEKRAYLLGRIAQFSDPADSSNLNFGKRIGEGTTYAIERMTGAYQARTLYETVKEIDRAVARLDEGSYGRCTGCGEVIPAGRLAVVPTDVVDKGRSPRAEFGLLKSTQRRRLPCLILGLLSPPMEG